MAETVKEKFMTPAPAPEAIRKVAIVTNEAGHKEVARIVAELKAALAANAELLERAEKAEKVRDEWCAEYVKLRDSASADQKDDMCKWCGRKDEARKKNGCPHCRTEEV